MKEWNVLVLTHWGQEKRAIRFLAEHGEFYRSGFKDVLRGHVIDVAHFLEKMEKIRNEASDKIRFISQIIPVEETLHFELNNLIEKLKEILPSYIKQIEGKKFYVRVKRRGYKGELSSHEIEKEVAGYILQHLEGTKEMSQVSFSDPDVILLIETIANWAGVTLITKEMKENYPLLKVK